MNTRVQYIRKILPGPKFTQDSDQKNLSRLYVPSITNNDIIMKLQRWTTGIILLCIEDYKHYRRVRICYTQYQKKWLLYFHQNKSWKSCHRILTSRRPLSRAGKHISDQIKNLKSRFFRIFTLAFLLFVAPAGPIF